MKNSRLILILIAVLLFNINTFSQVQAIENDSIVINKFYYEINKHILIQLDEKKLDTTNFIGFYSFKFSVSKSGRINFENNFAANPIVCSLVNKAIVSVIESDKASLAKEISERNFVLPLIVNYQINYWKKVRSVGLSELSKLFVYEGRENRKPSFSPYTGQPIEGILLNTVYYETPHFSTNKKFEKLKKAKSL
jgi:hypothetical protein